MQLSMSHATAPVEEQVCLIYPYYLVLLIL